jgi:hypothetical protein
MKQYERPMILTNEDLAEGVYAASGDTDTVSCDSKYMSGSWKAADSSDWNGGTRGYMQQFGCTGCPATRANGCGLLLDYVESNNSSSYEANRGNYMPSWERKGYQPYTTVSDWSM